MKFKKVATLSAKQQDQIAALSALCLAEEADCSVLTPEDDADTCCFLAYDEEQLVAGLSVSLYEDVSAALLLSAETHPAYRRQGLFSALLKRAKAHCERTYEFTGHELPFSCYINSATSTARQVLDHMDAYCVSKEFLLSLDISTRKRIHGNGVYITESVDLDTLSKLQESAFSYSAKSARAYISMILEDDGLDSYLILEGDTPVGLFHLLHEASMVYLCGFGIDPQFQGRGLGTRAMDIIVDALPASVKTVRVQVSDRNVIAHHLYLNYGFTLTASTCEYRFSLPLSAEVDE